MKVHLKTLIARCLGGGVILGLYAASSLAAQTSAPPTGFVTRVPAQVTPMGEYLYTVDFPGGRLAEFIKFWRTNGFPNDTILTDWRAEGVHLPKFTVTSVTLKEVGKSLEFVSDGRLQVEVIEKTAKNGVNLWRISYKEQAVRLKVRACPAPYLLGVPNGPDTTLKLLNRTQTMLSERLRDFQGHFQLLPENKVVIILGPEDYVEGIANVVMAAEQSAAAQAQGLAPVERQKRE